MRVARTVSELERVPRAVAVGSFDGVHVGHRRVLQAAVDSELRPTVVTFYPHPRTVLGNQVDLLATFERRLELLEEAGVDETLVVEFTLELAECEPEEFAERILLPIGTELVVAGEGFRFGRARRGDLALLERLGFDVHRVPLLAGVSSTQIRELLRAGEIEHAARLLDRPPEVDGIVVAGDARGGTLGFPTANLRVDLELLVPEYGIYAGATAGHRAAVSIGVNPHYGGTERRVEVYLLDFAGDLYGERLVVELWERLRDERAFVSEAELVEQIAEDVERTRLARPPVLPSNEGKS
jgi:riboflavin kinase / FMN adenylyltransferase